MIKRETKKNILEEDSSKKEIPNGPEKNICDFSYLTEMMGGKKHLINEILEAFLKQVPIELQSINEAVAQKDFQSIKNLAHTIKSSVSIMGISVIMPVLQEMEELGAKSENIERITELNNKLHLICKQVIEEVEKEHQKYN